MFQSPKESRDLVKYAQDSELSLARVGQFCIVTKVNLSNVMLSLACLRRVSVHTHSQKAPISQHVNAELSSLLRLMIWFIGLNEILYCLVGLDFDLLDSDLTGLYWFTQTRL